MKFNPLKTVTALCVFTLLGGMGGVTAQSRNEGQTTRTVHWQIEELNGEAYVKASDVVRTLGGSGTYRSEAGEYIYSASSPISEVVKSVSPSIVGIIGKQGDTDGKASDNRFNLAHGTGIIVDSEGLIVTNAHVVKDLKQMIVVTSDGKQYAGKLSHTDEESDLALVTIDATGLQAATFAETAQVEVGETVVAIGTPISFALRNSVTVGVVSGMDRSLHSTYRLIQTDAAINPGNSGGALVNLKGEVIGINSLKLAAAGIDGLGFAIPADTVQYVLHHFEAYGKVKHPSLGVDLEESWAAIVGLPTEEPLKVARLHNGSPAADAGIREGDVLFSIDNYNMKSLIDLNERLKRYLPGDKVTLTIQSNGDIVQKEITLIEAKQ
ncbi:S1C family serine protease [Paenibacillus allorhizosphaerae]|uniref:PDZ domain-containing protein n=1 Tax=Paenibacillus allorhizosphaerae TaxID=2849866 RepID=A0ABM8VCW4_9BACL|nr:trypsin-like peptidase domain-containing protein [Paenibacillus allorhizosphaerae]CAG7624968.1 hypothetical protein PAECIP111802_01118 [Paenibacillus allorhizosphaerae]